MHSRPLVIAHRTCPRHVAENSLEGIRLAHVLGVDGVEIDVQTSLDGVLFLHHDHTLWRKARLPLPLWMVPAWLLGRLPGARDLVTLEERWQASPAGS
jgi:glycerophosphoryl diester phosphodiesterase